MPTPTPMPTPMPVVVRYDVEAGRVLTIDRLSRQKEREWTDGNPLVIVGCHTGVTVSDLGEHWYTFSRDGRFNRGNDMAGVTGFTTLPWRGACMEMAVTHDGFSRFCYYESSGLDLTPCTFGNGWYQETPMLYLVDPGSIDVLTRAEWREQHGGNK